MSERDGMSVPKFDGDYEHWAMLMENLLRSKEWWDIVETGIAQPERNVILTGAQRTEISENKLKDLKAKNYLFASIDKGILKTIANKDSARDIWESMKTKYQGNKRVQNAQLQRMRRDFEILEMKDGDTISEYFSRVMVVANDMRNLGEEMTDSKIVEKILRTLVEKYTYVVCAIEESKDITELSVDALQSSLLVHEQKLTKHEDEGNALKVEARWNNYSMRGRGGYQNRGRGRSGFQGRGRGRASFNKETMECFKCHKLGHFKSECPEWEKSAHYAEMEEEVLLMAHVDVLEEENDSVWFLDSGCSNHMCGTMNWFVNFDPSFKQNVKLGDNRRMRVEGKGDLRLLINGVVQLITAVYYVPELKSNLLSVGQLQQKGLRIIIEDDICEIWHKKQRRVLMMSTMTKNRMFVIQAVATKKKERDESNCLKITTEECNDLWHKRLGHLSIGGMKTMSEKHMVNGLPKFTQKEGDSLCDTCAKGKQIRQNIPKKSDWRSTRGLELVHTDICGPIAPTSEGGKRYIINFIDDFSRKCWTYFLCEKSEALKYFKEFKASAEKELGVSLKCLRSDRGGEYNSTEFQDYCKKEGIRRQLTAAYTPQQNGIAERKNRSVMNTTRCMMIGMSVPRRYWPEAVQYAVYILNRSPSKALNDVTPEEKWSNLKPSVEHLKVFGCVAYALVPYERRTKLDEKSVKCVMFGVSKESKAYRLYNPETKKIIISRDTQFDEKQRWNWEENREDTMLYWDENGDDTEEGEKNEEEIVGEKADTNAEVTENATEEEPVADSPNLSNVRGVRGRVKQPPVWMKDYVTGGTSLFIIDEEEVIALYTSAEDPETFDEAALHERWRKAMEDEIESIVENNTWEMVDVPHGAKTIGVKWIYKTKYNEKGEVNKLKARLVAKGYNQRQGIDFEEVFAPVARWDTIRTLLAKAAQKGWKVFQLDVKSAFLHGDLSEDVFIEQPRGFEVEGNEEKVYKLKKALYGLRQAPRAWYSKIEGYFTREGFNKCYCEHTLFVKTEEEKILIVSLYVDDLIYTGNSNSMLKEFKNSMMNEFSMTDLGMMKYFLGMEVIQGEDSIFINQEKYALEVIERFGMMECNAVRNPMVPGQKMSKEGGGEEVGATDFKKLVGSLRYLTATRPDLIYSVNLISRYMECPKEQHLLAAKRILRYVRGTAELGIKYKRNGEEVLVGYVDSDYAGDQDDRKSTSGYVFMLSGGAVSWASKKQAIVTLSTTEAEFVAAAYGACQGVWQRNILEEIGEENKKGTVLFCDNSSTIKL